MSVVKRGNRGDLCDDSQNEIFHHAVDDLEYNIYYRIVHVVLEVGFHSFT